MCQNYFFEKDAMNEVCELWRSRELLYFFAWREIKVRYRQAAFGASWAIIQPVMNMVIFSLLFGKLAGIRSDGVPYPLFCYCALVPWSYFSTVVGIASNALINNEPLLTKVYFPRVLLPVGSVLAGLVDFAIGSIVLFGLMFYYHVRLGWGLLLIPAVVAAMIILTAGLGMATAAVNVRFRDVRYALPFLLQIWMYATPVVYPMSAVPEKFRPLLALNPCWIIVEGLRAAVLPGFTLDVRLTLSSLIMIVAIFIGAAYYFRRAERSFADII
jgi:lipopolysaccharide transport system permease protein